jgi:hypothetical protein
MKNIENGQFIDPRPLISEEFSWITGARGCIINAGSTIGGNIGHDIDMMFMFDCKNPTEAVEPFLLSLDSMETTILKIGQKAPIFCFSRVAWQDFMAELVKQKTSSRAEPTGVHFLWYSSPEQLLISEPRGLALGLLEGQVLAGSSELVTSGKSCCPNEEERKIWSGLDSVLDPIRLVANPTLELGQLNPTIGHTIERFVIWDILGAKIRGKKGFDLVTRNDIQAEKEQANPLVKSLLKRSRDLRDNPESVGKQEIIQIAIDVLQNWEDLRN